MASARFRLLLVTVISYCTVTEAARPNFVFILADDLDWDYKRDSPAIMPNLKQYFLEEGSTFVE